VTIIAKMCENTQPVEVGTTTHILPPGCRVYLSTPAVHYNDDYWENATELKPERWSEAHSYGNSSADTTPSGGHTSNPTSDDSKQTKSSSIAADKAHQRRGTLITFSDGARSCRGRKFAQAEYVAFFAALLYEFEVTLAEGVDRDQVRRDLDFKCAGKFTLTPLAGTRLEFKRREEWQG
jgi:cytochrome P450